MNELTVRTERQGQILRVWYNPRTSHSIYDICDAEGSVIKTGEIQEEGVRIDVSDLEQDEYLLLILDGDDVVKKKVQLDGTEEGG